MNFAELNGDVNNQSEWLKQNSIGQNTNGLLHNKPTKSYKFVCHPILKCGCNNPIMMTSNNGYRHQKCLNCKWSWNADKV
uniref:Uncharacterized protein n=1 Tax=viral metagenome TaxID=1070528 RepID=A0A6C0HGX6_9ZZZZ